MQSTTIANPATEAQKKKPNHFVGWLDMKLHVAKAPKINPPVSTTAHASVIATGNAMLRRLPAVGGKSVRLLGDSLIYNSRLFMASTIPQTIAPINATTHAKNTNRNRRFRVPCLPRPSKLSVTMKPKQLPAASTIEAIRVMRGATKLRRFSSPGCI